MLAYFQTWKKVDKDYIHTIILEAAYLIIAVFIIMFFLALLNITLDQTNEMMPSMEGLYEYVFTEGGYPDLSSELGQKIVQNTEKVEIILVQSFGIIILLILLLIANSCFFKSIIWARVHDQKWNKKYLFKFAKLNSLWLVAWLVVFILTMLLFTTQIAAWLLIVEFVLFIYLTNTWRAMFDQKKKNFLIAKKALKLGLLNIYRAVLPVLAIILTFIVLIHVIFLAVYLSQLLYTLLFFLGIIFLICFSRSYFNQVVKRYK